MSLDVVVAGGGPVGLMLACELRLAGVSPVVLERAREPSGLSKALGLGGRSVTTLDHRGLLERLGAGVTSAGLARFAHFGGVPLPLGRLGGAGHPFLPVHQAHLERLLEDRARELDTEIRRGHELLGLHPDEEGVTLDVRGPEGDHRIRARYLVGCDGAHSVVRHLAGVAFPGLPPTRLLRLGDVRLPPGVVQDGYFEIPGAGRFRTGVTGVAAVPLDAGFHRVVTNEPYPPDFDRHAPMTLAELSESLRRALGADLPIESARWVSRFTDGSRQAEHYRVGRTLLAGDAAHIQLPAGGPGLNAGLQDAVNLGWKLAAEVRGWAPPGLLDSYHAERHPVGERMLLHTRAQGALLGAGEQVKALRQVLGEILGIEQAARHVADLVHGLDVRHEMHGGEAERHPLIGGWVPDLPLSTARGRTRVAELMRGARGVLLDLTGRPALTDVAARWEDRVDAVTARCDGQPAPADALLVRPDGYVAWAGAPGRPEEDARRGLEQALTTWFGAGRAP